MEAFTTFQQFDIREDALELGDLLHKNHIEYQIKAGAKEFNPAFVLSSHYEILVKPEDLDKVAALLTANVDKDYYLYSFTDGELLSIIVKKDEWSHFDYMLAQKILREHGKEADVVDTIAYAEELARPKKASREKLLIAILVGVAIAVKLIISVWNNIQQQR